MKLTCKACGNEFEGHGRREYCDECMTVECACGCGTFRLGQFTHRSEHNYRTRSCMRNAKLRGYVARNMGRMSALDMARKKGVSRQRIYQLMKETREEQDARR